MKRKELHDYIRAEIINELSLNEGTAEENAAKAAELKSIDAQIKALTVKKAEVTKTGAVAEVELEEMARTANKIKLGDPAKVTLVKKLYGGTWKGDMLDVVEKAGEEGISQLELALAVGKKSQPEINPSINEFLKIGAFALSKVAAPEPMPAPSSTPSGDEDEWEAAASDVEKDEWEKAEDEDKDTDKGPSASDIKAAAKATGGKGYAKQLSPEDEEKYTRLRTGIEAKVSKILALPKTKRSSSTDLQVLKTLIKRDDVKKLFKAKGVNLNDLVSDVMN
jgi:hypothetical protein